MAQEDKELLLKDLSGRLSYGVKFCFANSNIYTIKGIDLIVTYEGNWEYAVTAKGIDPIEIEYVKPYLRPMSSMTDEEKLEYLTVTRLQYNENEEPYRELTIEAVDWLNSHSFDYRGLIEKGLALEAPEGMYK